MRRIAEGTKTNSEDTTNSSARKDNAYTRLLLVKKPGNRKEILIETGNQGKVNKIKCLRCKSEQKSRAGNSLVCS